ncbi:hypothetical protein APHAL10511_005053 [Amanita phalloides]|nr:hypothetical protein APHAL10511_005053 [Amanita phalloides]
MVLIHKLKQAEGIDVQQLREQRYDHNSTADDGEHEAQDQTSTAEEAQDSQTESQTTSTRAISPPRRPLTRSQTGYVPKRRPRDDSPVRTNKSAPVVPRKRPKAASPRKQTIDDPELTEDELAPEDVTHAPDDPLDSPTQSQPPSNEDSSVHLTFLNSNADGSIAPDAARRTPRSRVVLPVPVPNLTKKSRGRRVPTTSSSDTSGDIKDGRLYVCKVEGCGKCFYRGEHLKRHIRSIHTHEKPFKCTYPQCEKLFNRHDNLLQHLKVHREPIKRIRQSSSGLSFDTEQDDAIDYDVTSKSVTPPPPPVSKPVAHQTHHLPELYKPMSIHPAARVPLPTTVISYSSITSYPTPSLLSSEPLGFSTNMAVSSIRTEIPASPRQQASTASG